MRLRHLLFFLALFCLPGCFAVYLPEPLIDPLKIANDSVIALSLIDLDSSSTQPKHSLGHQYLFPGLPVTSLYFERNPTEVLGEYLLYHPKLGRGARAVTNLSPSDLRILFGPSASAFKIKIRSLSTTAEDYFLLRRAVVEGKIDFYFNSPNPEQLEFDSSRFISKASVEVISEMIEENLFNSLNSIKINKAIEPTEGSLIHTPTIICFAHQHESEDDPCPSRKNISIGVENYFKKKGLPFVSFRDSCANLLPKTGYSLLIAGKLQKKEAESLELEMDFSLNDLRVSDEPNDLVRSKVLKLYGKPNQSSSEPECAAIREISEKLANMFFAND